MQFITLDKKISLRSNFLQIQSLPIKSGESYWLHSFLLMALVLISQVLRAAYKNPMAWFMAIPLIFWMFPHFQRIFNTVFIYSWKSHIKYNDIQKAVLQPAQNEWETVIVLKLKSGRIKKLTFRNLEQQADGFLESLQQRGVFVVQADDYELYSQPSNL